MLRPRVWLPGAPATRLPCPSRTRTAKVTSGCRLLILVHVRLLGEKGVQTPFVAEQKGMLHRSPHPPYSDHRICMYYTVRHFFRILITIPILILSRITPSQATQRTQSRIMDASPRSCNECDITQEALEQRYTFVVPVTQHFYH